MIRAAGSSACRRLPSRFLPGVAKKARGLPDYLTYNLGVLVDGVGTNPARWPRDREGRHSGSRLVSNRRRDAAASAFCLFVIHCIAALSNHGKVLSQPSCVDDRPLGDLRKPHLPKQPVQSFLIERAQKDLAHGRRMEPQMSSNRRYTSDDIPTQDLVHVDSVVAIQRCE